MSVSICSDWERLLMARLSRPGTSWNRLISRFVLTLRLSNIILNTGIIRCRHAHAHTSIWILNLISYKEKVIWGNHTALWLIQVFVPAGWIAPIRGLQFLPNTSFTTSRHFNFVIYLFEQFLKFFRQLRQFCFPIIILLFDFFKWIQVCD